MTVTNWEHLTSVKAETTPTGALEIITATGTPLPLPNCPLGAAA